MFSKKKIAAFKRLNAAMRPTMPLGAYLKAYQLDDKSNFYIPAKLFNQVVDATQAAGWAAPDLDSFLVRYNPDDLRDFKKVVPGIFRDGAGKKTIEEYYHRLAGERQIVLTDGLSYAKWYAFNDQAHIRVITEGTWLYRGVREASWVGAEDEDEAVWFALDLPTALTYAASSNRGQFCYVGVYEVTRPLRMLDLQDIEGHRFMQKIDPDWKNNGGFQYEGEKILRKSVYKTDRAWVAKMCRQGVADGYYAGRLPDVKGGMFHAETAVCNVPMSELRIVKTMMYETAAVEAFLQTNGTAPKPIKTFVFNR